MIFSVDYMSLFAKEALSRRIKENGKFILKQVASQLKEEFLKLFKIDKVGFGKKNNYMRNLK